MCSANGEKLSCSQAESQVKLSTQLLLLLTSPPFPVRHPAIENGTVLNRDINNKTKVPICNEHPSLELRLTNIPPPPPGYEDSGDEFYLDKPEDPAEESVAEVPTTDVNETMNLSEEEDEQEGEVLSRTGTRPTVWAYEHRTYNRFYLM